MSPPTDEPFRTLIVEDEPLYAQAIGRGLAREGVGCDLACDAKEAMALADAREYHAVLLDHRLPDDDGIRILPRLRARQPGAAVVVMTAYETIPDAIQAIRQGAEDYLVKQTSVAPIVERVLQIRSRHRIRQRVQGWSEGQRDGLLGDSPGLDRVREQLRQVARSPETTVLLLGETGVGKEVAARELHRRSGAAGRPFVTVDCLALPANLVESLVFGHEKGAFTGAESTREGACFEARDGTLFLDEIGELDLALQGKLLRVLETRTYQRVGSVRLCDVRARVVAATNRDLGRMVAEGRFRLDLFQRLSAFPLEMPPLRERAQDIPLLAQHFLEFFCAKLRNPHCQLEAPVLARLEAYDYPGNVRELRNLVERAVITAEGGAIASQHLPDRLLSGPVRSPTGGGLAQGVSVDFIAGVDTLETVEKKMIIRALQQTRGVKSEAAALLGISRFQLLRRLEKHGLE
jgi:DNA-binding NtrC family response regulator